MMTSETSSLYSKEIQNENMNCYRDTNKNIVREVNNVEEAAAASEGESIVSFTMCGCATPFK
jgi:hypothetical protein